MMPTTQPQQYKLLSSTTVPLTKDKITEHKNLPASPTERVLNPKRVEFLRERLDAGLFHPPHWVQARVGGKLFRANGWHSSTMLDNLNGQLPDGLMVHMDVYECPDMDSLAMLFRQYDPRQSSRGPADVSGAYQGLRMELADVPREVGRQGVEAIAWFRQVVLQQKDVPVGDDRYVIFNEPMQHAYLIWLAEVFTTSIPREMRKPPILAAMYACFNADKDIANDFWKEVAGGGREYEEDWPTTVLSDWLRRIKQKEFEVKPKGYYQGCLFAWNAIRDGKTSLSTIRCDVRKTLYKAL